MVQSKPQRNAQFDILRLLFATLVLLSHAPELVDGSRSRELFTRLTHSSVSFGMFGVDGFFLLSGFLIVQSWQRDPNLSHFLRNRVLRIVPGYIVAALLSTLIIGLVAPGIQNFFAHLDVKFAASIAFLSSPLTPPVLPGSHYASVNGSLWTITYEFRCYLLVALFGVCGMLRRRFVWLGCTLLMVAAVVFPNAAPHWSHFTLPLGVPVETYRLTATYFIGGCFFLFRDRIRFRPWIALVVSVLLIVATVLRSPRFELYLVLCGGYLMFYLAQHSMHRFAEWRFPDISYGVYLYGWPVEALLIRYFHTSPWIIFAACLPICFGLGWVSWHFIERPALALKRRESPVKANSLVRAS